MEFLSCSVSDQLDFSTEELGDTHKPELLLHPALAHNSVVSIPQKRPIIRGENSAAFLVTQGKDEAFSQVVV